MTVIATCWEKAALLGAQCSWAEGFSTRRAPIDAIFCWYKTFFSIYFVTVIATCWEEAALLGARRSWAEGSPSCREPIGYAPS